MSGSYLHRHHLHQDGEVGEVSAAADRVAEVPLGEHTALVGPDPFSGARDTGEKQRAEKVTCWCLLGRMETGEDCGGPALAHAHGGPWTHSP